MKCAGIVLAAGASRRLGQAKQHLRLGSETLLERAVRTATAAGLAPVIVVLPPEKRVIFNEPVRVVTNHNAAEGMASSIRLGVETAIELAADAVIMLTCDQPAVTAKHLGELIENRRESADIVASAYAGRKGIPAYFPASAFPELLLLHGDTGARDLIRGARTVSLNGGQLDIDTAEDLALARLIYDTKAPR